MPDLLVRRGLREKRVLWGPRALLEKLVLPVLKDLPVHRGLPV